jgi:uncharacterized protein YbjT (DUF2867 family)
VTSVRAFPVLVTGATGHVGRLVVDQLLETGIPVRALTRRPDAARLPDGVEVIGGDLSVPPSRIAFLSAPHKTPHPFFQQPNPMEVMHANIEQLIATAGIASTFIRPGMFASNTVGWWAEKIRRGNGVRWPYGSAETAPIDERDIAAVAARMLVDDSHVGGDYVLTGPESLTQAEQVSIIGESIGRPIRFQELSPDEFRNETAGSWPRPIVDMLLAAWGATMGHPAYVTSTVADVTGVPPRTFRQWAIDHVDAFQ